MHLPSVLRFAILSCLTLAACSTNLNSHDRDILNTGDLIQITPEGDEVDTGMDPDVPSSSDDSGEDTSDTDTTLPNGDDEDAECPEGMVCVDQFPFIQSHNTEWGLSNYDAYGCAPSTDESGPEILYRLDIQTSGFLALELTGMASDVDVDVQLLWSLNEEDCMDRGHFVAASWLEPGTYYVTADSWVTGSGDVLSGEYTILMGFTEADGFTDYGLDPEVLEQGLYAFDMAWYTGETDRFEYTIIDFEQPSYFRRWWTIDLATSTLLFHEFVTHGMGSNHSTDPALAVSFSNTVDSHQSSLGMMRMAETYWGTFQRSMRMDGLEPGFNDNVRARYIVTHPGDYATQEFVDAYGYLGRSWGCTALDPAISDDVIDTISYGSLMWTYYPDSNWLSESPFLAGF